jgi:hypothetical protein
LNDGEKPEDLQETADDMRYYADSVKNEEWGNDMVFGTTDWIRIHPSRWK